VKLATGFDLYAAQAAVALGLAPPQPLQGDPGVAGVQFVTATGTVAHDVEIGAFLAAHPDLSAAGQFVTPGTVIGALDTNGVRAGYVMARAGDRDALAAILDAAAADLTERIGLLPARTTPAAP